MKPKLANKLPEGALWQYELKLDGYRAQCHLLDGRVKIYSKNGKPLTKCLPGVVGDLTGLEVRSAVIDGEACMLAEDGSTDFFALHAAVARGHAPDAVLFAFDLLHLDGEDLRKRPLIERRAILAELLVEAGPHLDISDHYVGEPKELLRTACSLGLEGIVAKRRDGTYRSGYVDGWLKVKCTTVDHFAVVGHEPEGRTGVSSLKLATLEGDALVPCGSVGSGLASEVCREIRAALDAGRHVVVDVEHRGRTPAGELRHPVFKGWHEG
jgi:bifunctional non-homologous end joining protein LigD